MLMPARLCFLWAAFPALKPRFLPAFQHKQSYFKQTFGRVDRVERVAAMVYDNCNRREAALSDAGAVLRVACSLTDAQTSGCCCCYYLLDQLLLWEGIFCLMLTLVCAKSQPNSCLNEISYSIIASGFFFSFLSIAWYFFFFSGANHDSSDRAIFGDKILNSSIAPSSQTLILHPLGSTCHLSSYVALRPSSPPQPPPQPGYSVVSGRLSIIVCCPVLRSTGTVQGGDVRALAADHHCGLISQ